MPSSENCVSVSGIMTRSYLVGDIIMWSVILELEGRGGENWGGVRIGISVGREGEIMPSSENCVSVSGIMTRSYLVGDIIMWSVILGN